MKEEDVDNIIEQSEYNQAYEDANMDYSELKEQRLAEIINKIIKSDYDNILVNDLKMFAQEMKTANLDKTDYEYLTQVFSLICNILSFKERYNLTTKNEDYLRQLLKNAYSRMHLSNSKSGGLVELFFKNVNEHSYKRQDNNSNFNFLGKKR